MKRIVTLDFLRGIAMLGLVFFHAFEQTIYPAFFNDLFTYPIYIFIPMGLLFMFAGWRGFFILISGAVQIFTMQNAIETRQNRFILLVKQLFIAIILFFHGIMIQIFWNPYNFGMINLLSLQWSDAVEIIAISSFLSSIIYLLLTIGKGKEKHLRNAIIFFMLMTGSLILTPYITNWVAKTTGFTPSNIQIYPATNWEDRLLKLGLALLIGYQEPIFPYFGIYCLGCILGIVLSHPHLPKNKTLLLGYGSGFGFIIGGLSLWAIKENFLWSGLFMIPPMWLLLVYTGVQILIIFGYLQYFEFSRKILSRIRFTHIIRRAGMLSLTIFTFQIFDYIPRWILTHVTDYEFLNYGQLSLEWSLLCGVVALIYWMIVLRVWGLLRNYFTIEWLLLLIKNLIQWQKVNWKDPLSQTLIIENTDSLISYN